MSRQQRIGYGGQRYEVRCQTQDGREIIAGWTNAANGGKIAALLAKQATLHLTRIIDLKPNEAQPQEYRNLEPHLISWVDQEWAKGRQRELSGQ